MIAYHRPYTPVRIRLTVLDLDGTTVNAFGDIAAATNRVREHLGLAPIDRDTITSRVGNGVANLLRRCLPEDTDEATIAQGVELWREFYNEHPTRYAQLYPDCLHLLEQLHRQEVINAMYSNKLQSLVERICHDLGLSPYLTLILGDSPEVARKPDPSTLLQIMERFGSQPEETVIVGDGAPDMRVAAAAGAWAVGVTTGLLTREQLTAENAHVTIDRLGELLRLPGMIDQV